MLGELKEGSLCLGSNESERFGLRIDVLKGGGVNRDRLVDQALELGVKDCIDVALLGREVISLFPIDLRLVGSLGQVLILGLVLLLSWCVRAGLVVLEIANEFRVNPDRAGDDAHDVLSERSSLVGANDGSVGHGQAGAKNANEQLLGGHPFCGESEGEGYCERETFGNSDDDQCDGDDQDVCEGDTFLARSTTRQKGVVKKKQRLRGDVHLPCGIPSAQLNEGTNHESGEHCQTRNTADLGDKLDEIVQLLL